MSPSLMGLVAIIKSRLLPRTRKRPLSPARGTFSYKMFPFGLCNDPTPFKREVLGIFYYLILFCV